ncbi:MAG: CTP synthase [bacterium]
MVKYIFVTGGVVSSLGKGIAASSIGTILESLGLKITLQKLDPYINVDPGTMNPYQHGEVYVTSDGAETDLDLGHYERFTEAKITKKNNVTTGKIYYEVIRKERKGEYLGNTVQVIPHITDEIKGCIKMVSKNIDVAIIELGGTVGDIESLPYLEAIRQLGREIGRENVLYIHLTLVPYIASCDEAKTKPTQHSVMKLREIGIQPDILLCRTQRPLSSSLKEKISLFCNVRKENVIDAYDVESIYEVPLSFKKQGLDRVIIKSLSLSFQKDNFKEWEHMVFKIKNAKKKTKIAIVGKYIEVKDAYKSIVEALYHGGIANNCKVEIKWVDAESKNMFDELSDISGILIPGGFGYRGIEGKIKAAKFARVNKVPFLGICLGLQCAVIDIARDLAGLSNANSSEFDQNTSYPVIDLMKEQRGIKKKGGTMRLGIYPCRIEKNSLTYEAYQKELVKERHRHRYEFNNKYRKILEDVGIRITGIYPEENLVEIVELKDHPWFVAVQFHPEFQSKPTAPHPLFSAFIKSNIASTFQSP